MTITAIVAVLWLGVVEHGWGMGPTILPHSVGSEEDIRTHPSQYTLAFEEASAEMGPTSMFKSTFLHRNTDKPAYSSALAVSSATSEAWASSHRWEGRPFAASVKTSKTSSLLPNWFATYA